MEFPKMKFLDLAEASRLLKESGLLFEINRSVLHPFGLALAVMTAGSSKQAILVGMLDGREDEEGLYFDDKTYREGLEQFEAFKEQNRMRLEKRIVKLGYLNQGEDAPLTPAEWALIRELRQGNRTYYIAQKSALESALAPHIADEWPEVIMTDNPNRRLVRRQWPKQK